MRKEKAKKSQIRTLLEELWSRGFFDEGKTLSEVIEKFSKRGFNIQHKKIGLVARLLTEMCQVGKLERESIPPKRKKLPKEKWLYKKIK